MWKDQFHFSSILALGATLNILLYLAIGRIALILAPLLLVVRFVDALLQTYGFRRNPLMDHVLAGTKLSAQYPAADGSFGNKAANDQVVIFTIGARCNHPLGIFAPGYKQLGDYFDAMVTKVEKNAVEFDYLGSQHWVADGQRSTGNEIMTVMFFKNVDGLHKFAHAPLHREGWDWWNKTESQHGHIGIWHEVFVAPKGHWETIYINSQPLGLGATTFPIKTESGLVWQNPLVDAKKGLLRSSRGRLAMGDGTENVKYGFDPYDGKP